jgi:hypothetical protein
MIMVMMEMSFFHWCFSLQSTEISCKNENQFSRQHCNFVNSDSKGIENHSYESLKVTMVLILATNVGSQGRI